MSTKRELEVLRDEYTQYGRGTDEYIEVLKDLEARTACQPCNIGSLTLLHFASETEADRVSEGKLKKKYRYKDGIAMVIPIQYEGKTGGVIGLPHQYLFKGETADIDMLMRDALSNGFCIGAQVEKKTVPYGLSRQAARDFAERAGVACRNFLKVPSLERDIWMMSNIQRSQGSVVTRSTKNGDTQKIFAIRGHMFKYASQVDTFETIRSELEQDLGDSEGLNWVVSNSSSQIILSFPEKGDDIAETYREIKGLKGRIEPIVRITDSDIGLSSLIIEAGFKVDGYPIFRSAGSVSKIHDGSMDIKKVMSKAKKKLFKEYNAIPEQLNRLLSITFKRSEFKDAIDEIVSFVGLEKIGGMKKPTAQIKSQFLEELFDSGVDEITGYEFVLRFVSIPDRIILRSKDGDEIELSGNRKEDLERSMGEAFFCPFESKEWEYTLADIAEDF